MKTKIFRKSYYPKLKKKSNIYVILSRRQEPSTKTMAAHINDQPP